MKVKVKKEDRDSNLPRLLIMLVFGIVSVGMFIFFFFSLDGIYTIENFIDVFSEFGMGVLFAIVFFAFDCYFIHFLLKKPKRFRAILVKKEQEIYKGKNIISMTFNVKSSNKEVTYIKDTYKCYVETDNNLEIGKDYEVLIKEFDWNIVRVESLSYNNKLADELPTMTLLPVILGIEFIFGTTALLMLVNIVYNLLNQNYNIGFSIIGLIFSSIFCIATYNVYIGWNRDNSLSEANIKSEIANEEIILNSNGKKVPNLIIRQLIYRFFYYIIFWYGILVIISIVTNNFYMVIENFIPLSIPIIFIEIINFLLILSYIDCDNRLIKKYNINVQDVKDISCIKKFNIIRVIKNTSLEKYFIVDDNNNLLYKVQKCGLFGNKYVVTNHKDSLLAEISRKLLSLEYTVRPIERLPYSIRQKLMLYFDYEVLGVDYIVKGDESGIDNFICDKSENVIASIQAMPKNDKWVKLGESVVRVHQDYQNNTDIIFLSLCVTIGNYQRHRIINSSN